MKLTNEEKSLIVRVINVFETGKPDGAYGLLVVMKDGPHKIPQITYGRSQTTEYGLLRDLVQRYVSAGGTFSAALAPFADDIGSKPLTDNLQFRDLLRRAGREDPVMHLIRIFSGRMPLSRLKLLLFLPRSDTRMVTSLSPGAGSEG